MFHQLGVYQLWFTIYRTKPIVHGECSKKIFGKKFPRYSWERITLPCKTIITPGKARATEAWEWIRNLFISAGKAHRAIYKIFTQIYFTQRKVYPLCDNNLNLTAEHIMGGHFGCIFPDILHMLCHISLYPCTWIVANEWVFKNETRVSNHRQLESLCNNFIMLSTTKIWKLRLLVVHEGNPSATDRFPSQRANNESWRIHE